MGDFPSQPIIRRPGEWIRAGVLALVLGWLLMTAFICIGGIVELVGGILWWSFGK